jgi:hypothetical protein
VIDGYSRERFAIRSELKLNVRVVRDVSADLLVEMER